MPGRYALYSTLDELSHHFDAKVSETGLWEWDPNYNISPGTVVPVIAWDGKRQRKLVPMRWGLHPHWKKEPPEGRPMFNARVETASEKASFRTPFRRRRALFPVNGWYEWDRFEGRKTPYYIREVPHDTFAFAGLWDQWRVDEGITLLSATVLTTHAPAEIKHIHHRVGVRLPESLWDEWLNWDSKPDDILEMMKDGSDLEAYEVSDMVNSGRSQGPELMVPA